MLFRAPFRLLSARAPRQAVLRASFWLAPCFSFPPPDLAISRRARRVMRLTDFCHLNDTACTRISCVPSSLRDFRRVDSPRSLGLRAVDRGTECFTTPVNASADRSQTRACLCLFSLEPPVGGGVERGRYLPTAPATDRASDISVASPSSAECRSAFALLQRALASSLFRVRKPPRSP
jgi:hypothetical protein